MKLLISLFLLVFPINAYSTCGVDCVNEPSCLELGYSKTITCPNGHIKCPFDSSYIWCKTYTCADGRYDLEPSTLKGYQCSQVSYHSLSCYDCKCVPTVDCKWTIANAGRASLTDECCDGTYASCASSCPSDISVPKHADPVYSTCKACGIDYKYISDFTCIEGYEKNGNECVVKACELGYSTQYQSVADCGTTGSLGYSYDYKSKSGELLCGKCEIRQCPNGESVDVSGIACEQTIGWEHPKTSNYEGETPCYKEECVCNPPSTCTWVSANAGQASLTDLCCNGNYSTCTSTCPWVELPEHAKAIDSCAACGYTKPTAWECVEGYVVSADNKSCEVAQCADGSATVAEGCGNGTGKDIGWSITDTQVGLAGTQPCYSCEKNECVSGDTVSNVNSCGYPSTKYADKVKNKYYNGDDACYDCVCDAPEDCNWESGTEQYGTLSELCCNGMYATCTSKCVEVEIPDHAHVTAVCTGCNKTVNTAWACDEGYTKSSDGKSCEPALCEGYPISGSCPAHGSCSECLSGETMKYKLDACEDGYVVNGNVCAIAQCNVGCKTNLADCGTSGGWEFGADCNLSGADRCKTCVAKNCADGDTISDVTSCNYPSTKYASKPANGYYSGNNACYTCKCEATNCKWDASNKGQASLSVQCCNGNYETCTPNCKDTAIVPENGKAVKENCTACGETTQIIVDFECNVGYAKEGNKCVVVTCNAGCAADLGGCGNGTGGSKGWEFGANCNISGTTQCKTCVAKTCPSGSNTNANVTDCTSLASTEYASKVANGSYSGDSACYDCKCNAPAACKWSASNAETATLGKLCCNGYYETCTSNCKEASIPQYAHGTTQCTGCGTTVYTAWACNDGYTQSGNSCVVAQCNNGCKTDVASCGTSGSKGWTLGSNCNMSGTSQCKTCVAKTCTNGNTNTNVSDCTAFSSTKYASKTANGYFSGDSACYDCTCNAPASCKWTENNANSANISNLCCNGYYETCTSTCAGVTVPANATSTGTCTGCGVTVDTGWKCNTGYTKNAAGTACIESPCDGYNIAGSCPTHGTCSQCVSGTTTKLKLDSCDDGYVKNASATACVVATCNTGCSTSVDSCGTGVGKGNGYTLGANCNMSGTTQCKTCVKKSCPSDTNTIWSSDTACNTSKGSSGWVSSGTTSYNGDSQCYSCTCSAPSTCKWDSSNKGSGTTSGLCCNGKYDTCTSSCKAVTVPEHATGTTQCTGCGTTVYTDFACNTGYKKNAAGTACIEVLCDDGSATKVADCGTSGSEGWELGTTVTGVSPAGNCYKCIAKTCATGSDTNSNVSTCGYSSTSYASKPATGKYSGDSKCYSCQCNAPAACKWTNSNKETASISGLCCNGSYSTCTSNCKDTVTVPANATAVTTSCTGCGTTVSIKTGWNCNDGYTKNSGGTGCNVATCESGCVLDINSCGTKSIGSAGWSLGTNCNLSGTQQCKKCTAKSCPSGSNTGWSSANACNSAKGTIGWTSAATSDYSGDSVCYSCTCSYTSANCPYTDANKGTATIADKCCNGQYKTCKSTCAAVTVPTNAHSTATCTGCGQTVDTAWACNTGYTKNGNACDVATCNSGCATSAAKCGSKGSAGWTLGSNCNMSGTSQCKTCTKRTCESGCSTSYTSAAACKTAMGYSSETGASITACSVSNGDTTCYKCSCTCDSSTYKWDSSNKGNANLSNQCCNGKYKTCTSTCAAVTVPANAHSTATCTGCGSTVNTAWACDTGFVKNSAGTGCVAASCPTGSSVTAAGCATTGDKGYDLNSTIKGYNGTTPCYQCVADGCSSGDTNSAVSSCGYSSTTHATKTTNGDYNGESPCYSCACDGDSYCSWTDSNKGTATLSTLCCNGKYKTCTSTCKDTVTVPANATGTKTTCKACEQSYSITTGWTCNTGYVKNSTGTGCTAATCCAGSTSYNSASACKTAMGYPSETGVGYSSAGCTSGGKTCYTCSCSCSSSTYKWNSSNVGQYGKVSGTQCCSGNYDKCVKNTSFPTSISYPANSTPSYTTYTACNGTISEQVVTGWSCNTCYTKSGSSCVASDCTSGYATSAAGCGSTGTSGWTVNTSSSGCSGGSTCYKCVAKSCPSGYATSASGCGTNGANGWTVNSTKSSTYNGQNACYQCVAKTCDSTYQTSAASCGAGGSSGWTLSSTDKCYAGATTKYKCVAKNGCTSGYSTSIQTAANCGAGGATGWTVEFSGYNGNTKCGKCVSKNGCASGYSTSIQNATNCGVGGSTGWTVSFSGYSGNTQCGKCTAKNGCTSGYSSSYTSVSSCGAGGSTGWDFATSGYNGNTVCGKCTAKNGCASGYSTSIQSASNCGVGGSTGWTVGFSGYNGNTKCGKCTAKNGCASGYSSSYTSVSSCGAGGSTGWDFATSGYNGNTVCGKCTAKNGCASGYSASIQSASNCGVGGATGWTVSFSGYNGNTACGKCNTRNGCTSGYSTSYTSVSSCGAGGSTGWTFATSGYYGNTVCGKCTAKNGCDSGYSTSIQSATDCGVGGATGWTVSFSGYNGNTKCGKCTSKNGCASGYSTSYTSVSSCGVGGATGWTFTTSGYTGNTVCGKCTAKNGCSSGYSSSYTSVSSCGSTGSSGWTFATSGYNGNTVCGKCTAKSCPSGYSTSYSSVSSCGVGGSSGWTYTTSGYSGQSVCGKCTAKNGCGSGYSTSYTSVSSCGVGGSSGWTFTTSGYNGNTVCGKCTSKNGCGSGYSTAYTSVSSCGAGGSSGWTFTTSGYTGNTVCGKCTAKNGCSSGYSTSIQTAANCGVGGSSGWTVSFSGYNGNTACGKCTAKNGCSSGYSTSYTSVSSCGSTGSSGWTFATSGYNGNTVCGKCTAKSCPSGYSTAYSSVSSCGSTGSNGWTYATSGYSGQSVCGKCTAKSCPSGCSTSYTSKAACKSAKGYSSETGVSYAANGYSGQSTCYCCSCSCSSSTYKWNSSNKGTANLTGTLCCNGNYSGCSETCADVTVPANATRSGTCTGCGVTYSTSWNPNSGYCRL